MVIPNCSINEKQACHSRRQAGIQSGVAAETRAYISGKQQASSPCRHSRIKRRGFAENESGYAGRHIQLDCPANNNMGRAMTNDRQW